MILLLSRNTCKDNGIRRIYCHTITYLNLLICLNFVELYIGRFDVSWTASSEISLLVCLSVCLSGWLSICLSVTKFSQDWMISFFLILYMMISDHWRTQIFERKIWLPKFGWNGPKLGHKLGFFSIFSSLIY